MKKREQAPANSLFPIIFDCISSGVLYKRFWKETKTPPADQAKMGFLFKEDQNRKELYHKPSILSIRKYYGYCVRHDDR